MTATRIPEAVKRIFTETFTARDVAEPLASFDADAPPAVIREFMVARDFDVVGIRSDGQVVGYVEMRPPEGGDGGPVRRTSDEATVLDDATPLLDVLMRLNHRPFAFI